MECPDENMLSALVDGAGMSEAREACARHLDACASCRQTVASMVRLLDERDADGHATTLAAPGNDDDPDDATAIMPERLAPGTVVAEGRYRLERIVGAGGLGVVWAATRLETGTLVALKVLRRRHPELDRRFMREARIASLLAHPNVVGAREVVEVEPGGLLAMEMELLDGESLDRLLLRHGRLDPRTLLRVMRPVLSALASAHALGIVHRDIKPQNIFIAREGDAGRGVLLDFGLAKLTAMDGVAARTGALTREAQILGTPHYMSPEQLYGEADIDARADVWAAGAVLFECLTGERPVAGRTMPQVLRTLATRDVPKTDALAPGLPAGLGAMIDRMLTRDRSARLSSVEPVIALADELLAHDDA